MDQAGLGYSFSDDPLQAGLTDDLAVQPFTMREKQARDALLAERGMAPPPDATTLPPPEPAAPAVVAAAAPAAAPNPARELLASMQADPETAAEPEEDDGAGLGDVFTHGLQSYAEHSGTGLEYITGAESLGDIGEAWGPDDELEALVGRRKQERNQRVADGEQGVISAKMGDVRDALVGSAPQVAAQTIGAAIFGTIGGIAGSVGGPAGTVGGAAGGAMLGRWIGGAVLNLPSYLGENVERAKAEGLDFDDPVTHARIMGSSVTQTIMDNITPFKGLSRIGMPVAEKIMATVGPKAIKGGINDAVVESVTELGQNMVAEAAFNPELWNQLTGEEKLSMEPWLRTLMSDENVTALLAGGVAGTAVGVPTAARQQQLINRARNDDIARLSALATDAGVSPEALEAAAKDPEKVGEMAAAAREITTAERLRKASPDLPPAVAESIKQRADKALDAFFPKIGGKTTTQLAADRAAAAKRYEDETREAAKGLGLKPVADVPVETVSRSVAALQQARAAREEAQRKVTLAANPSRRLKAEGKLKEAMDAEAEARMDALRHVEGKTPEQARKEVDESRRGAAAAEKRATAVSHERERHFNPDATPEQQAETALDLMDRYHPDKAEGTKGLREKIAKAKAKLNSIRHSGGSSAQQIAGAEQKVVELESLLKQPAPVYEAAQQVLGTLPESVVASAKERRTPGAGEGAATPEAGEPAPEPVVEEEAKAKPKPEPKPGVAVTDRALAKVEVPPLPRATGRYFARDDKTVDVPVTAIKPGRVRSGGIERVASRLRRAYEGKAPLVPAISVRAEPDGAYTILDGNATYANARKAGWKNVPVRVMTDEEFHAQNAPKLVRGIKKDPNQTIRTTVTDGRIKVYVTGTMMQRSGTIQAIRNRAAAEGLNVDIASSSERAPLHAAERVPEPEAATPGATTAPAPDTAAAPAAAAPEISAATSPDGAPRPLQQGDPGYAPPESLRHKGYDHSREYPWVSLVNDIGPYSNPAELEQRMREWTARTGFEASAIYNEVTGVIYGVGTNRHPGEVAYPSYALGTAGTTLTHTHPKQTPFSSADVRITTGTGQPIRAILPDGQVIEIQHGHQRLAKHQVAPTFEAFRDGPFRSAVRTIWPLSPKARELDKIERSQFVQEAFLRYLEAIGAIDYVIPVTGIPAEFMETIDAAVQAAVEQHGATARPDLGLGNGGRPGPVQGDQKPGGKPGGGAVGTGRGSGAGQPKDVEGGGRGPEDEGPDISRAIDTDSIARRVGLSAREILASTVSMLYGRSGPPRKMKTNKEAATWLQNRTSAAVGAHTDFTAELPPKERERIARTMAAEVMAALEARGADSAADWYTKAIEDALDIAAEIWPALRNEQAAIDAGFGSSANARFALTYALATASQNLDVSKNTTVGAAAFDALVENIANGIYAFPPEMGSGDKQVAMNDNFAKFGPLFNAMPSETPAEKLTDMRKLFAEKRTVKEWEAVFARLGVKASDMGATLKDTVVYGSSMLGPKIGNGFYQNLNGNYDPVTIDLWLRRTWGRLTGKSIGNESSLPDQITRLRRSVSTSFRNAGNHDAIVAAQAERQVLVNQLRSTPVMIWRTKKERNEYEADLKRQIEAYDEMIPDLVNMKIPEAWDESYATDREALFAYVNRLNAHWNKHYKGLQYPNGEFVKGADGKPLKDADGKKIKNKALKVSGEVKPTWAKAAKMIKAAQTTPIDQVANGTQRREIEGAIARARSILEEHGIHLTNADMQAILWYPEKDLWAMMSAEPQVEIDPETGEETPLPISPLNESYDTAFRRLVAERKKKNAQQAATGDGRGGAGAGGADAGGNAQGGASDAGVRRTRKDRGGDQGPQGEGGPDISAGVDDFGVYIPDEGDPGFDAPTTGQRPGRGSGLAYEGTSGADARELPSRSPLEGLPAGSAGPNRRIAEAAEGYLKQAGIPLRRQAAYVKVDRKRGKRLADAFDAMADDIDAPGVREAYEAMAAETIAQYRAAIDSGLQVSVITRDMADPYPEGPKQVLADLRRGHMWVYPTEAGYGTANDLTAPSPMLEPTEFKVGKHTMLVNDLFRVVHDFFGHGREGVGFGASGEENTWQSHVRMFGPLAARAMTSETRGQNSWVNYGPHGEHNRNNQRETIFADQKLGLLPEWAATEGMEDAPTDEPDISAGTDTAEFKNWFKDSVVTNPDGTPRRVYHGTDKAGDFTSLQPGTWFTADPDEGSAYAFPMDLRKREKASKRYAIRRAPELAGTRLPYYGTTADIDNPEVGKVYATDLGVLRARGNNHWTFLTDLEPDYDAGVIDDEILVKAGDMRAEAEEYVAEYEAAVRRSFPGGDGGRTYPVYLSIQNPVRLGPLEANRLSERLGSSRKEIDAAIAKYKKQGYDGIVTQSDEGALFGGQMGLTEVPDQFVVFDPTQVKSAIGNRGTYDPDEPDIAAGTDIVNWPDWMAKPGGKKSEAIAELRASAADPGKALKKWGTRLETWAANSLAPIRVMEVAHKGYLPEGMDSDFKSAEIAVNDSGRNETLLYYGAGALDNNGGFRNAPGTIGIRTMLQKLGSGQAISDWMHYMAARRSQYLTTRPNPVKVPLSPQEITEGLAKRSALFDEVAADWKRFNDANIDLSVETGTISAKLGKTLKADATYIPFYRVDERVDDAEELFETFGRDSMKSGFGAKGKLNNPNPGIMRMKGGEVRKLDNLIDNMVRNAQRQVAAAMRNRATNMAVDTMVQANYAQVVKGSTKPHPGAIKTKRDGKERWVMPIDSAAEPVFIALAGMKSQQLTGIHKFMQQVASSYRSSITLTPPFMIGNLVRGVVSTALLTTGANIGLTNNVFTGGADSWRRGPVRHAFTAATGMGDYRFGSESGIGDNDWMVEFGLAKPTFGSKWRRVIRGLEDLGTATELGDRLATMQSLIGRNVRPDEAAYQALTLANYNRKGSSAMLRNILPLIPFLNARIQGLARLGEGAVGRSGPLARKQALMQLALNGAILWAASSALWLWNNEDEERRKKYEAEPLYRRLNYHIVYFGDYKVLIPKAFELGVLFGSTPELMMEAALQGETEELGSALIQTLGNTFGFNAIPQALKPALEAQINYSFFTGQPIVSDRYENVLRRERLTSRTSTLARGIGQSVLGDWAGMSPLMVDHLLDGYGGAPVAALSAVLDVVAGDLGLIPSKPTGAFGDVPIASKVAENIFGRFFKDADADQSSRYVEGFYDLKSAITQVHRSAKSAVDNRNIERARDIIGQTPGGAPGLVAANRLVNRASSQLTKINEAIRLIEASALTSQQKRERLNPLIHQRNALTSAVYRAIRDFEDRHGIEFSDVA